MAATELELFFNELSLHGQFFEVSGFAESMTRVMRMREVARRYGRELRCHRNTANAAAVREKPVQAVLGGLERDARSALMQWLTKIGPFWDDERQHGEDDYLECRGEVVTDTGIGEAAFGAFRGFEYAVVSVKPSDWLASPLSVTWESEEPARTVEIGNYSEVAALRAAVVERPRPISSWDGLERAAGMQCPDLVFSPDAFTPLSRLPFRRLVAERLLLRLRTLQRVKDGFDSRGRRTAAAEEIYRTHFSGEKAQFSDSSESEKIEFRSDLTFPHPAAPGESLFCPWHGKVKTPQLRIHFSWPIEADTPLFVVYVGPKITKR